MKRDWNIEMWKAVVMVFVEMMGWSSAVEGLWSKRLLLDFRTK